MLYNSSHPITCDIPDDQPGRNFVCNHVFGTNTFDYIHLNICNYSCCSHNTFPQFRNTIFNVVLCLRPMGKLL